MKIYKNENVFDAALDRIRYVFDEFPNVIVGFSGGKDSTVTLNLALKVAEEKNRLPLKVLFVDQEAEWQTVIDYIRVVMSDSRVDPIWLQMPIKLFNATSTIDPWLYCWEEGKEWIRPREKNSIKINKYGTDRFKEVFGKFIEVEYPDTPTAYLAGVRAEESPSRFIGLTGQATYKYITWGKYLDKNKGHYTFYPLYDWSYTDIWKAILDNEWKYCRIYDFMYQHGLSVPKMRVSNVHHETAIHALFYLQEVEPDNWNRLTKRIHGISTAGQMQKESFFMKTDKLPYMFKDWKEYRDYLTENLLANKEVKDKFTKRYAQMDKRYRGMRHIEDMYIAQINCVLTNDFYFTKLDNWERIPEVHGWRIYQQGRFTPHMKVNKYING